MQTLEAMPGFTFGCDPELFVTDPDGNLCSAEGLIPGTKEEPYKVDYGAVQVDGVAAEFNTDPASTFEEWNNNIVKVVKQLKSMLPKGYNLLPVPSVNFTPEQWERVPAVSKILGCSPDYNAWTGEVNKPPMCEDNPYLRTASGHLHIGWTELEDMSNMGHIVNCQDLVKQLDFYLGAWSLQKDEDPIRRQLYGNAGSCRYKDYGVEYRVLSNFWITRKDLRLQVWNRMQKAIWDMSSNYLPDNAVKHGFDKLVIQSINTSKRDVILEDRYYFPIHRLS